MRWHTDADEHALSPSRFRERVTWFDLWSFGTRCLQLAPLQTYATFLSPSLCVFCVRAFARVCFGTFNKPPVFTFCLIASVFFLFPILFPLPAVHCCCFVRFPHNDSVLIHFVNKRLAHVLCCSRCDCSVALCCTSVPLGKHGCVRLV